MTQWPHLNTGTVPCHSAMHFTQLATTRLFDTQYCNLHSRLYGHECHSYGTHAL